MTVDPLYHRIDDARIRAGLTVQDLWLRYVACGGNNTLFDADGYLQGLIPMNSFELSVLSQTVNEALQDSYNSYSIPLADPEADGKADARRRKAIQQLLDDIDA